MISENIDTQEAEPGVEQTGPERVREAVAVAATRLFAQRGIHAVSVREIAREVGVSHTLLHLYFGSKEEIVRDVLSRYDGQFAAMMSSSEAVDATVADIFRQVAKNKDLVRVLAAALVEGVVPHNIETEAQAQNALVERLDEKRDDGSPDPRIVSAMIAATVIGWAVGAEWLRESVGLQDMTEEQSVDEMASLLERMVRDCT